MCDEAIGLENMLDMADKHNEVLEAAIGGAISTLSNVYVGLAKEQAKHLDTCPSELFIAIEHDLNAIYAVKRRLQKAIGEV